MKFETARPLAVGLARARDDDERDIRWLTLAHCLSSHSAADGAAHAAADPDAKQVRMTAAAIALAGIDASGLDADKRLQPGDRRTRYVAVGGELRYSASA